MTRRRLQLAIASLALVVATLGWYLRPLPPRPIVFPNGKRFAFSIVDDTDLATLDRVRPVYETLIRYGLRTTKTVWVVPTNDEANSANLGDTLADEPYRAFVKDLKARGFEIALHGVRGGNSQRAEIAEGLETFRREVGTYPTMHINHSRNPDNLYWDRFRFSLMPLRLAASVAMAGRSRGHDPASDSFWGDLAQRHIRYVRQFTFQEINLLNVNPSMPFKRSDTPYVNLWFQTANGANRDAFVRLLSPENLDRLEREGGVCLVYSHLGAGSFAPENRVAPAFEARIADLASRNGWFAPASEILDYLTAQSGWTGELSHRERVRLETAFATSRVIYGVP